MGVVVQFHRLAIGPGLWETGGMPKQEQPRTHENGEAKKLVDRIAKNASDQRLARRKRSLRVVKWLRTVPAVGVCTACDRQFHVPLESMKRVADAQWNLNLQFTEHECNRADASQAAVQS